MEISYYCRKNNLIIAGKPFSRLLFVRNMLYEELPEMSEQNISRSSRVFQTATSGYPQLFSEVLIRGLGLLSQKLDSVVTFVYI